MILYVGLKGYFRITKRAIRVIGTTVIIVLTGYAAIYYSYPKRNGKGLEGFLYKIKISPIEPFKTRINADDWKDFNDNYRSYENIITVNQVSEKGTSAVLFGEGLGSTLNLGRKVWSNDGEYVQYIPIVHNGYMTVFLKSGILGVLFLIYFLVMLFRQKKSDIATVQNVNFLLTSSAVFLVISYWVFLGLYLKLDNKSIILGFLFALREIIMREQSQAQIDNE